METQNHQKLLFFSLFSLLISINSAQGRVISPVSAPAPGPSALPLSNSLTQSDAVDPALKQLCDQTDYPEICIQTISPYLNGSADVFSVIEMGIKAAEDQALLAINVATEIAASPFTPMKISAAINSCKEDFEDAVENYDKALDALPGRDYGTMNSMLSAAITDFSDCAEALGGADLPVGEFGSLLLNMTSNCLAFVYEVNPVKLPL